MDELKQLIREEIRGVLNESDALVLDLELYFGEVGFNPKKMNDFFKYLRRKYGMALTKKSLSKAFVKAEKKIRMDNIGKRKWRLLAIGLLNKL